MIKILQKLICALELHQYGCPRCTAKILNEKSRDITMHEARYYRAAGLPTPRPFVHTTPRPPASE